MKKGVLLRRSEKVVALKKKAFSKVNKKRFYEQQMFRFLCKSKTKLNSESKGLDITSLMFTFFLYFSLAFCVLAFLASTSPSACGEQHPKAKKNS